MAAARQKNASCTTAASAAPSISITDEGRFLVDLRRIYGILVYAAVYLKLDWQDEGSEAGTAN